MRLSPGTEDEYIMHGWGTRKWATGAKYVGNFKDGQASGQGVFTHENGDEFEGTFEAD